MSEVFNKEEWQQCIELSRVHDLYLFTKRNALGQVKNFCVYRCGKPKNSFLGARRTTSQLLRFIKRITNTGAKNA